MTARDLDQPRMVYTGTLPPHLTQADDPFDDVLEPADETPGTAVPVVIVAAAALGVGIAIGVFVPPLFHGPPSPVAAGAPPPALALAPTPVAAARAPASEAPRALTSAADTPKPAKSARPRAALALLSPTPAHALHAARKVKDADPCPLKGSRADRVICTHPEIAAAAQDMERAYWRAVGARVPAEALRSNEVEWLLAREEAATRSPADLANAYRARTVQLETMADDPPH